MKIEKASKELIKLAKDILNEDLSLLEDNCDTYFCDGCNPIDFFKDGLSIAEKVVQNNLKIFAISASEYEDYVFYFTAKSEKDLKERLQKLLDEN